MARISQHVLHNQSRQSTDQGDCATYHVKHSYLLREISLRNIAHHIAGSFCRKEDNYVGIWRGIWIYL